jgi:hypothetical protein
MWSARKPLPESLPARALSIRASAAELSRNYGNTMSHGGPLALRKESSLRAGIRCPHCYTSASESFDRPGMNGRLASCARALQRATTGDITRPMDGLNQIVQLPNMVPASSNG